ncbi:pyridoxamine 5'-phosphate oxidase family protein [Methyloterricola oryzae]|uniref:pyridoxamine 5'-phosphate oxidase family protein n=1 Tax=Methyloterricola oryzae TaxID=1495050 RepID=UPI0005EAF6A4|nr:pyridoxamine 5'-phosphate oxidase family protein [Methyloterricola oryzae]
MLTPAMKQAISRAEYFPLATATPAGVPNVVPIRYLSVAGDDRLWITDNYLLKTLDNLRGNPQASVFVWSADPKLAFQIKGTVEILTEGADYERMKAEVRNQRPDLPARALVVLHIAEIYECLPGPDAGKRLFPAA